MALSHTLPIYIDTYKLILLLFERTSSFGREYKYTLGQDMKRDGINLVRSIYRANKSKNKVEYLEEFLDLPCLNQQDATKREKYLKTHYGKMFKKNLHKSTAGYIIKK